MATRTPFDPKAAVRRLLTFLAVPGITGQEKEIGRAVADAILQTGIGKSAVGFDDANKSIPLPTETGNLIVRLPGTIAGPRLLFATHLDTVPLCDGAKPVQRGRRIVPAGKTALGGDNRTGVGCLVTLLTTLVQRQLPHPPLTFLFSVREESGLWGARFVDRDRLGHPVYGFNFDGSKPFEVTVGAVGAERWEAEVHGRAAHAGVHPERGISASVVTALALADVHRTGWFGKIKHDGKEGTSNVGSIGNDAGGSAGNATNVVTDFALVRGEARSHDAPFVRAITRSYRDAFQNAAQAVRDDRGRKARVRFKTRLDYHPFRIDAEAPVVRHAQAAVQDAGMTPTLRTTNGGLDANWLVRHGIPTVTFGAGQRNVHTTEEYVHLPQYLQACELALALVARAVKEDRA